MFIHANHQIKMRKKFIIIPGCSDLNRGDQALVWETKRLAEEAGYIGDYYLTTEKNEPVHQSTNHGLNIIQPVLEHPSRAFKNKENIEYNFSLKLKWGVVALWDFIFSLLLLNSLSRSFLKLFLSKTKKESLNTFKNAEAVFMKGGGIIHAYGGFTATYFIYFALYHIFLASALKKPIYIMPNSFGPFEGPFVKFLVKKAFSKCKLVSTRETYSQKMVKAQLSISPINYPDLAFFLSNGKIDKTKLLKELNIPSGRKLVALTMRPHRFPKSSNPQKAYSLFKQEMALFIEWLYSCGYMPVLIEHTLAINAHENDGSCIQDVIELLDNDHYRFYTNKEFNCYELKSLYSICDYIVGTRFHSVIFSISNNVPGIAITYAGNKGQGIMNDIGLNALTVSIDDVSSETLKEKFSYLQENETSIKVKIANYNNSAVMQRKKLIESISPNE